jgi:DNA polymerase III delta subunit
MIFAYFGTDTIGVRKAAHDLAGTYLERGMTLRSVTPETYVTGVLSDLAGAVSLFEDKQVVILDTPSANPEMFEAAFGGLELLAESENVFIFIEEKLLAPEKKRLEKYAERATELNAEKAERFNAFGLADAFLRRDKKSLWILLMKAWEAGLSDEEIIGTLYWQVKMLRLAERTKSAEEAGQKPFVYSKAKRALSAFKEGELDSISRDLLSIYHDGHLGKRDIDLALERWVLTL